MLLHTGRSGLCPSDLCLFKRDLSEVLTPKTLRKKPNSKTFSNAELRVIVPH